MKKIIAACLLSLSITSAHAQPQIMQKPVQCATPIEVINQYVVPNNLKAMFIAIANVRTQFGEIIPAPIVFFYNPNSGSVTIDGQEISSLDLKSYRDQMGYVGQEPILFNATIRENMQFSKKGASDAEIE